MFTRREFLTGSIALTIGSHHARLFAGDAIFVNDIHSQLNRTRVDRIVTPMTVSEVQSAVREAKAAQASARKESIR